MHEYTVVNHPKHIILFIMAFISTMLSSLSTYIISKFIEFFTLGTMISFSISGFTIFGFIYWCFNKYWWKLKKFSDNMKFPNLSGQWFCEGNSYNINLQQNFNWESIITITQHWDKILILNKTVTSSSQSKSVVGGVRYVEGKGYEVSYHYLNTPSTFQESDLKSHEGFCVLCFSEDLHSAEGYYFNNVKDRASYGEMKLKKVEV